MACGKTSVGKVLADKLGKSFYDLDQLIEEKVGKTIAQIFEEEGETYFRQLESECLKASKQFSGSIIATGGGAPCFFDNMQWIKENGIAIFLQNSPAILTKRLMREKAKRPLVSRFEEETALQQFIQQKLIERLPFYQQAQITIQGDGKDIEEMVGMIILNKK